jgi:RNA polymerase sigma-70 factor
MGEKVPQRPDGKGTIPLACPLSGFGALVEALYGQSKASRWGLPHARFAAALERSVQKRFATGVVTPQQLEEYLAALYLEDLALACACAEGCEAAWEHFVGSYRSYLRAAAGAMLRGSPAPADAQELADSLFAELYGLVDGKRGERSLFRYFHGRSSLKTWLRAVLSQRHIDAIRAGRGLEPLSEGDGGAVQQLPRQNSSGPPSDPHRERYVALFGAALQAALGQLEAKDRERLRLYYAEEQILAEIGRQLGEHESSVSRHLERIRRELRGQVEGMLRAGRAAVDAQAESAGLSEAEVALCFEYASADAQIDLDKLFSHRGKEGPAIGRQEP